MKVTANKEQSIITRIVVSSEQAGELLAHALYKTSGKPATVEQYPDILDGEWFVQFFSDEVEGI